MAFLIAMLRVLYDETNPRPLRVLLESLICGALSLCFTSIIDLFNLPSSAEITIGGAIGFIGVTTLRNMIITSINKRVNKP